MFVVWGTKHKIKNVGVVGDRCEACGELAAFTVTDHFEAGHIYYISLTQGTLRATSKTGLIRPCHCGMATFITTGKQQAPCRKPARSLGDACDR